MCSVTSVVSHCGLSTVRCESAFDGHRCSFPVPSSLSCHSMRTPDDRSYLVSSPTSSPHRIPGESLEDDCDELVIAAGEQSGPLGDEENANRCRDCLLRTSVTSP